MKKRTGVRHERDGKAITQAFAPDHVVDGSSYGDVSWAVWCKKERARMNAHGDGGKVRIAQCGGVMWLTRGSQ